MILIFIILTNLEEFNLARQALSLGAVEYLVKNGTDRGETFRGFKAWKRALRTDTACK